jgi:hypothetical protein
MASDTLTSVLSRTWLVAVLGTAIALASAAPASAASMILSGQTLEPGQTLRSADNHYELAMQADGNLVLYWLNNGVAGRALWSSGTDGDSGAHATLQSNGNLVLYSTSGQGLWSSNTSGAGCSNLDVQGDGNLVLYNSTRAAWATNTVQHQLDPGDTLYPGQAIYSAGEEYEVTMQTDGNFVLYGPPGALWATHTNGILGNHAIMQTDGNLVVYSNGGRALWASHTAGDKGAVAVSQSDGNFVVYAGGKAKWDTATNGRKPSTGPSRYPKPAFVPCPAPQPPPTTTTTTTTPPPPPPPTKPSHPDPVVLVPQPTKLPRLRVRVVMHWTWDFGVTRLHRIAVPTMPRNATFSIKCKGRGCRGYEHATRHRLSRLIRELNGRAYRAGDRLLIEITERGHKPERIKIEIRYGKGPSARLV